MSCGLGPLQVPKTHHLSFPHQSPPEVNILSLGVELTEACKRERLTWHYMVGEWHYWDTGGSLTPSKGS